MRKYSRISSRWYTTIVPIFHLISVKKLQASDEEAFCFNLLFYNFRMEMQSVPRPFRSANNVQIFDHHVLFRQFQHAPNWQTRTISSRVKLGGTIAKRCFARWRGLRAQIKMPPDGERGREGDRSRVAEGYRGRRLLAVILKPGFPPFTAKWRIITSGRAISFSLSLSRK